MLKFCSAGVGLIALMMVSVGEAKEVDSGILFFNGGWHELLQAASQQEKMVFVDVYTTWCGPCKKMASAIFPLRSVGDVFNAHFVSYKLDAEDENANGPALTEHYEVAAFPTYLFLESDGSLVHKAVGFKDEDRFITQALLVAGEVEPVESLIAKYDSGNRDPQFIRRLLLLAQNSDGEVRDVRFVENGLREKIDAYLAGVPEKALVDKDHYLLISRAFRGDLESRWNEVIRDRAAEWQQVIGSPVEEYIRYTSVNLVKERAAIGDNSYQKLLDNMKGVLLEYFPSIAYLERLERDSGIQYLYASEQYDEYVKAEISSDPVKTSPVNAGIRLQDYLFSGDVSGSNLEMIGTYLSDVYANGRMSKSWYEMYAFVLEELNQPDAAEAIYQKI